MEVASEGTVAEECGCEVAHHHQGRYGEGDSWVVLKGPHSLPEPTERHLSWGSVPTQVLSLASELSDPEPVSSNIDKVHPSELLTVDVVHREVFPKVILPQNLFNNAV